MTVARRKLVKEIIDFYVSYSLPEEVVRSCAWEIVEAMADLRKYRRRQSADLAELIAITDDSIDGDEIVGHRD